MTEGRKSKIRTTIKFYFDLIFSGAIRLNILQGLPFWIASFLVGIVAVAYAKIFSLAEDVLLEVLRWHHWMIFIMAPVFFALAWFVIQKFAPTARGSGIPQVMAAIELSSAKHRGKVDKLLSFRIIVIKAVSSFLMVLGGGAIGREGPTIQIAGSIFHIVNKHVPKSWPKLSKQSYILTGAAAGLAAAFNTPLGGVVFAIEELAKTHIRFFRTALFSAVIISGLAAQGFLGPYLYLGYPNVKGLQFTIFFVVALTGILAGIFGSYMGKWILIIMKWKKQFNQQKVLLIILGFGLLIAGISFYISDDILGSGKEIMNNTLFTKNKSVGIVTVIARIFGPVLSFNVGAAGGVFAPSLAAGASLGAFISNTLNFTGANANIIILSGMVGFLTGVTRSPFTSAILVLEMTDRHSVIFHLMLAAMLSNVAALIIDKHSFYDQLKNGYLNEVEEDAKTEIKPLANRQNPEQVT